MRRFSAPFIVLFWGVAALAQQPSTDQTPQTPAGQSTSSPQVVIQPSSDEPEDRIRKDDRLPPPTPLEEREKEIRKFDPLGKEEDPDAEEKARAKEKEKQDRETQKRRDEGSTPLPGSIAAEDARNAAEKSNTGPRVVGDDDATDQPAQYTGPAVLSHSYTLNGSLIPEDLNWRLFASASGVWDSGINAASAGPQGPVQNASGFGLNFNWGISGRHKFHRDSFGMMYTGSRPWYLTGNQFVGLNTALGADYTHIVSQHLSVRVNESVAIYSQSYSLQNPTPGPDTPVADINVQASPTTQVFDNGSKSFSTGLMASWMQSSRLSFTAGGSIFDTSHNNPALIGVKGKQAQGGVNYRLSGKSTAGIFYSYSVYSYPHGEGKTDSSSIGGLYSYAFSRSTQVKLRAGLATTNSVGLEAVPLNPIIAQLYGISTEIIEAFHTGLTEDISASLTRDFGGHHTVNFSYTKGISPGDGLGLTSVSETMSASTAMKIFGRYPLAFNVGRSSISSAGLLAGTYVTEYASVSTSKPLGHDMAMTFGANYRHFDVALAPGLHNQLSFNYGFTWNHSEGRLWPLW